jgi:hypothetical protein
MSAGPSTIPRPRHWPEAAQFNEAVQNLVTTMSDRELQRGEPELGPLGVPMPYAGNFADVYKVHCPTTGNTWAVKFFKREVRDLRERYRAISEHLAAAKLPFMVDFRYLEEGVRIGGSWYPLVKMQWIEGQSLNRFVAQSLGQPKLLDQLFQLWVRVAARTREAGIAHADLQHGNVVLVEGEGGRLLLKLIDYDGMFVPALAGQKSGELGHPNYQHPQREATRAFNPELDRFSHLAICCALRCLRVGGTSLWDKYNNEENLLFTAADFAQPAGSRLLQDLWMLRDKEAHALVGHLALATQQPLDEVPLLDDLLQDGHVRSLTTDEQRAAEVLLFGRELSPAAPPPLQTIPQPAAPPPQIVACPRCAGEVTMPAQASPEMQVQCPLCGGQYFLYEAIRWQPQNAAAVVPVAAPAAMNFAAPPLPAFAPGPAFAPDPLSMPFPAPYLPPARGPTNPLLVPVLWGDRKLARLAGENNVALHNFLRVLAVFALLVVLPWSLYQASTMLPAFMVARPSNPNPVPSPAPDGSPPLVTPQTPTGPVTLADMEASRRAAHQAAADAQLAMMPTLQPVMMQRAQDYLNQATFAAARQNYAEAKGLYDAALAQFKVMREQPNPLTNRPGPPPPSASGTPKSNITLDGKVDLLALNRLPEGDFGAIAKKSGRLIIKAGQASNFIVFDQELPNDYQLDLRVTPQKSDGLLISFPVAGRTTMLTVDGFRDKGQVRTALDMIDNRRPHDAGYAGKSFFGQLMQPNAPANLQIQVQGGHVTLECDGKPIVDWNGDPARLGIYPLFDQHKPRQLSIGTWQAQYEIASLSVQPLTK